MLEIGPQRHLQTTTELEFTDSGVVVLNSATRNAKSKAQLGLDTRRVVGAGPRSRGRH